MCLVSAHQEMDCERYFNYNLDVYSRLFDLEVRLQYRQSRAEALFPSPVLLSFALASVKPRSCASAMISGCRNKACLSSTGSSKLIYGCL